LIIYQTIVSLATLGAAFGSMIGGPFADAYGRKTTIILADVLFTIGGIVMGVAPNIPVLIIGRLIVGVRIPMIIIFKLAWCWYCSNGCAYIFVRGKSNGN
jgi:MFS family permease